MWNLAPINPILLQCWSSRQFGLNTASMLAQTSYCLIVGASLSSTMDVLQVRGSTKCINFSSTHLLIASEDKAKVYIGRSSHESIIGCKVDNKYILHLLQEFRHTYVSWHRLSLSGSCSFCFSPEQAKSFPRQHYKPRHVQQKQSRLATSGRNSLFGPARLVFSFSRTFALK